MAYTSFTFDPSRLGVYAEAIDPQHPDRFRPLTASEVMTKNKQALAAINGSMFDLCSGTPQDYPNATCEQVVYLTRDTQHRRIDIATKRPTDGITVSVAGGKGKVKADAQVTAGAKVAVQLYPPMILNGRDVTTASLNTDRVWRSAVGIDRNGKIVFAVTQNSMTGMAREMLDHGVVDAGYTDGGGSTRLAIRGQREVGNSENRRVPLWYVAEASPVVTGKSGLAIVGGILVLGLGIYAIDRTPGQS